MTTHRQALAAFTFTRVPNALLDHHLPDLSGSEAKLLLVLLRHTLGYQRDSADLTYGDLMALSGLRSRETLDRALSALETRGIFTIGRNEGARRSNRYAFNTHCLPQNGQIDPQQDGTKIVPTTSHNSTKIVPTAVQILNRDSTEIVPTEVRKSNHDKRKKIKKETKEKRKKTTNRTLQREQAGSRQTEPVRKLLVDAGIWPSVADRLISQHALTREQVEEAIRTLEEDIRQGLVIKNRAALLRSRLEKLTPAKPRSAPIAVPEIDEGSIRAAPGTAKPRPDPAVEFFEELMAGMRQQVTHATYNTWLREAAFVSHQPAQDDEPERLTIALPNHDHPWFRERLAKVIQRVADRLAGYPVTIDYQPVEQAKAA